MVPAGRRRALRPDALAVPPPRPAGQLAAPALPVGPGQRPVPRPRPAGRGRGLDLAVHDTATGRQLWSKSVPGRQPSFTRSRLAVDDRHVYPAGGDLLALRLADGKRVWRFEGSRPGARFGPPAVRDGSVYAQEEGRGLVAVDAVNGSTRWAEEGQPVTAEDLTVPPVVGRRVCTPTGRPRPG
ncbi:PQQ-binding-like beta-propeller repeat protein [Streptomyces sp. SBR177]